MHAVGHYMTARFPEKRIEYVSTESFTNDLINAIRDDKMTQFRNRYRSVDLLLVDDIQFLAGKERTQEEFFHTFNALYENHKQIILSSDRPPKDIQTLEGRLRSRFEWGLITDIQSPEFETRVAILKMNAEHNRIDIPQEVLELIARQVTSNIRELEGALMRVVAFSSLNNVPFSRAVAAKALSNVFAPQEVKVEMMDVLRQVAAHYNMPPDVIRGSGRVREVVVPRQVAQYLIRELTDHSLPEIGQFFGRDHSTVMHAISKVTEQIGRDQEVTASVEVLRRKMQGLDDEESRGIMTACPSVLTQISSKFRSKTVCGLSQAVDNPVDNLWITPFFLWITLWITRGILAPVDNPPFCPQVIHRKRPLIHNFVHRTNPHPAQL